MPKLTVQFGDKTNRMLEELAAEKGITKAEVIRRALAVFKYLDDETRDGDRRVSVTSAATDKILKDIILP